MIITRLIFILALLTIMVLIIIIRLITYRNKRLRIVAHIRKNSRTTYVIEVKFWGIFWREYPFEYRTYEDAEKAYINRIKLYNSQRNEKVIKTKYHYKP